jgi:hypothetical protein
MVAMTSINKPTMGLGISTNGGGRRKSAAELEEEKYKTPINGTGGARKAGNIGGGSKKGGVKLLVSKRMQVSRFFVLFWLAFAAEMVLTLPPSLPPSFFAFPCARQPLCSI